MEKSITLKDLRPGLPGIVADIDRKMKRYVVSKHGKPVVMMLSMSEYDSLQETVEILSDRRAIRNLQQGIQDVVQGRTVSWSEIKTHHGY